MNALVTSEKRYAPIGYFVHHQGRGHAERCAAVVNALSPRQPVTIFCARDDIFPDLRSGVEIIKIPSLFEATGTEAIHDFTAMPDTVHCAPLGWSGIRTAMGTIANWFMTANPVLMISDVSAEVAQLARLCSVPHIKVLQHGRRSDPAHMAAYDGAVGLLVPSHRALAQTDWTASMLEKSCFAAGLGTTTNFPTRAQARRRIGVPDDRELVVVMTGDGGTGISVAPISVGARALPGAHWISIGRMQQDWHATEPENLRHDGWVSNVDEYLAAADVVVSSTGNTTCHQILAAGKPWLAVPEWRYFDEQVEKAAALHAAGVAHHLPYLPASVDCWRSAISDVRKSHDPNLQRSLVDPGADAHTAIWIEGLIARLHGPLNKQGTHDDILPKIVA